MQAGVRKWTEVPRVDRGRQKPVHNHIMRAERVEMLEQGYGWGPLGTLVRKRQRGGQELHFNDIKCHSCDRTSDTCLPLLSCHQSVIAYYCLLLQQNSDGILRRAAVEGLGRTAVNGTDGNISQWTPKTEEMLSHRRDAYKKKKNVGPNIYTTWLHYINDLNFKNSTESNLYNSMGICTDSLALRRRHQAQ